MDIFVAIIGALLLAQFIDGRVAFFLGLVALVGWRVLRRRRKVAEIRRLGLPPEDLRAVSEDLQRGDRDAAIQRIADVQERQREALRAKGIDVSAITADIGREIKWTEVIRQVFRVLEFDRAGTTIGPGDTVKAASLVDPYGYLLVESPILNRPVRLPIVHRDDFLLAASVFDEPRLADAVKGEEELLVTYFPKHKLPGGLAGASHAVHYVICPRGTMDRYYEAGGDIHMAKPAPEKLFGSFVWEGEIRVEVNPHPML